jgi:hypothetical protein
MFKRLGQVNALKAKTTVKLGGQASLRNVAQSAARHMFNYNTVEALLLAAAVFVCLSGIMFQSGRFDAKEFQAQRDTLTFTVIFVVITAFVYSLVVFIQDILATLKPDCCVSKKKLDEMRKKGAGRREDDEDQRSKRPDLHQNPLFALRTTTVGGTAFPVSADFLTLELWTTLRAEYARVYEAVQELKARVPASPSSRHGTSPQAVRGTAPPSAAGLGWGGGVGGTVSPLATGVVPGVVTSPGDSGAEASEASAQSPMSAGDGDGGAVRTIKSAGAGKRTRRRFTIKQSGDKEFLMKAD